LHTLRPAAARFVSPPLSDTKASSAQRALTKNLHSFDASFFKISPKQAHVMDQQLRIMLEVTHEALIDAGVNPSTLQKSRTGMFIGVSVSDANDFWKKKPDGKYILKN